MKEAKQAETALDHVLKYTGIFGGVQGLTILMSIVRNKLASHFLGPIGFALITIYQSVADFVTYCTNLGIPFSSVRELSERYGSTATDRGHGSEALPEDADRAAAEKAARLAAMAPTIRVIRTWCLWTALAGVALCVGGSPLLGLMFFGNDDYRPWTIALLAPMIAALSITGGEISILKGLRRVRRVASISAIGAVSTLLLTVPFFWSLGLQGILLALNFSTVAMTCIHLAFTCPIFPYRVSPLSHEVFRQGWQLVRVGLPYVGAGIAGAATAMVLPALMKEYGNMEDIGLYRAAYGIIVTYAGIVFSAFEADYFPRLSSVNRQPHERNQTINGQIRVCTLLIAPLLIAMIVAMPLIVRLLYTERFLPAASMAVCAVFYMFLRAITTPISYTALACGDSMLYLLMEVIYDVVSLGLIFGCYMARGLMGAGIGLSLSALFDLLLIGLTYGHHYGFRISRSTALLAVQQGLLLAAALASCLLLPDVWRWIAGTTLGLASAFRSYGILARETTIIQKIQHKLIRGSKAQAFIY